MRVLQVIDTLEAGGAEHMAVHYANALNRKIERSYICCTRSEGALRIKLKDGVGYYFLNKSSTFDLTAYKKLRKYILEQEIDIVHAHSSSYFLLSIIKMFGGIDFKLVWHDHYGNSDFLEERPKLLLRFFSRYFDGIIAVNKKLANWIIENLKCPKIKVFRNFLPSNEIKFDTSISLKGDPETFKFICVANLRPQKDHLTLIKAFEELDTDDTSLHLVGMDFKDTYSKKVITRIQKSSKHGRIFFYGSQDNVNALLLQADAGVLSSKSEGLPLALLEYGVAGLPVICTRVGECENVLEDLGVLVEPSNSSALAKGMWEIYSDENFKIKAEDFQEKVASKYSESANLAEILKFYQSI